MTSSKSDQRIVPRGWPLYVVGPTFILLIARELVETDTLLFKMAVGLSLFIALVAGYRCSRAATQRSSNNVFNALIITVLICCLNCFIVFTGCFVPPARSRSNYVPPRPLVRADAPDEMAKTAKLITTRPQDSDPSMIDLTEYYNSAFNEMFGWERGSLKSLSPGNYDIQGSNFDVRGSIRLDSKSHGSSQRTFPVAVLHIGIHRKCAALNFLHGSNGYETIGKEISRIIVRYNDQSEVAVPIVYGRDVADSFGQKLDHDFAAPAFEIPTASSPNSVLRLFVTHWNNLKPNEEIASIDYISDQAWVTPFLIAITAQ